MSQTKFLLYRSVAEPAKLDSVRAQIPTMFTGT